MRISTYLTAAFFAILCLEIKVPEIKIPEGKKKSIKSDRN